MQGSGASAGDLIAVKTDGRGGRIKVLQSINLASLHDNMRVCHHSRDTCAAPDQVVPSLRGSCK